MTDKSKQLQDGPLTPLDSPCNLFYLRRAARAVSRQYSAVMKDSGLQATQFSVLFILNNSGPLSITELANKMGLDRTSMSRNLNPLQHQGLVSVADEGLNRTRAVTITASGRKVLNKVLPLWRQAQTTFIEHMGPADTTLLIELLGRASKISTVADHD